MEGFRVEPDCLVKAAGHLESAAAEVERFWIERDAWLAAGRLVGSDRIQRALAMFCEYWAVALRHTLDDSNAISMGLRAAAQEYITTDGEVVR